MPRSTLEKRVLVLCDWRLTLQPVGVCSASLASSLAAGLDAPQDGPIEVPDWPIVRLDNVSHLAHLPGHLIIRR